VVVILVVLIMAAMLLFVVPQFESIYANLGGTLPLPTRILLASPSVPGVLVADDPVRSGGRSALALQAGRTSQDRLLEDPRRCSTLFHKVASLAPSTLGCC
jgi:type IV pilus assembly protein PilC